MPRDLGVIDQYEKKQIDHFLDPEGDTAADKLVGYMLKLSRREVASTAALKAVRKLSTSVCSCSWLFV